MSTHDPHAVNGRQHEPRVPGAQAEEEGKTDPPGKPFRTPNKTKTHPAPRVGTDGHHETPEKESDEHSGEDSDDKASHN